jgi:SAM-dependent methyltransferase
VKRGTIFDEDARLYERARPRYPAQLFDDLTAVTGLTEGSRVLEIGCGTGQVTLPLAQRGFDVTALEPGPSLAALTQKKVSAVQNVKVVVTSFENWALPPTPFDAVVAATSFHWIDPEVRVRKSADALRKGGVLATIETHHVAGGDEEFFRLVQDCYERWDPSTPPGLQLPKESEIPRDSTELERSGRFGPATFRDHCWEATYSADEYRDLLLTYSGHRALDREAQRKLLDCIQMLIKSRFGGRVTKRYLFRLRMAERIR